MIRRFFSQAWLYFKGRRAAFELEEFLLLEAGYPFLTLVFYCVLAAYSFQTRDLTHWVVSNALLLCINTCLFGLGSAFNGERFNGRLRSILVSPTNMLWVVLESGFVPGLVAAVTVLAGFFLGGLLFGVSFAGLPVGLLVLSILAAMFAASGLGLLLAALSLLGDGMHILLNTTYYVMLICTGAQFPVSQLPLVFQWFSRILPLTRSIEAVELLLTGGAMEKWGALLLGELAVAAAYCILAAAVVEGAAKAARRKGNLELF